MERLTYRGPKTGKAISPNVCFNIACRGKCDGCVIDEMVSKLCAYEDTGLTPEEIADPWIYRTANPPSGDFEETMQAVEKALGFRLFTWQKSYIAYGRFRHSGATTAEILRDLLDVTQEPIDYTRGAATHRQQLYRRELREIKEKLDEAGIPTRAVFFSERDKRDYLRRREEGKSC